MTSWYAAQALLPDGPARDVVIDVADGLITQVRSGAEPPRDGIRLPGLVMPGAANAHSHAFHRALRGRTHADGGTFWTWRERMYAVAATLTPERYLTLARAVFAEMVLAGYTVVGEFHYVHHDEHGRPYATDAMGEALVQAAAEAGIRLTLLDTVYLAGGLDADGHSDPDPVQRRYDDGGVEAWAARVHALPTGETVRPGAAVHSVRGVPAPALREVAALGLEVPLHAHVSEQPAENEAALAHYGRTPVGLLGDAGLLGPRFTAVHATHLSADDIALLAKAGSGVCFCPTTERDLADGIGSARTLADAGVRISLGSDQHVVVDPFAEVQALEGHERLVTLQRGRFSPVQLRTTLCDNGYAALGWSGGGRLAPGAPADLVAVRVDSPRTAGSSTEQLLLSASAADVTDVVVGGEHVVRDGRHRLGDVGQLLSSALDPWKDAT